MGTSGKYKVGPKRFLSEVVEDPAARHNFDLTAENVGALATQLNGRNFAFSVPILKTMAATGKVTNLEATLVTSGRPVLAAIVPARWRAPTIVNGIYAAGGTSSIQLLPSSGVATPNVLDAVIDLYRNGEKSFSLDFRVGFPTGSNNNEARLSAFQFFAFDPQPAAKHRYEIYVNNLSSNVSVAFNHVQLLLVEF